MTKIFSLLFFSISLWVGLSSILSHIVVVYTLDYFFYYIIWIGSFFFSVSFFLKPIMSERKLLRDRFSKSISWPIFIKLINGITWALPFILILFFQKYYPFLLLTGLSLGNISTSIFLKKYSNIFSIEQTVTGMVLIFSLIGTIMYQKYLDDFEGTLLLSRIMISLSYFVGGLTGYLNSRYKNE